MIRTTCPSCSIPLALPANIEGRTVACGQCKTRFVVKDGIAIAMAEPIAPAPPRPMPPPEPALPAPAPAVASPEKLLSVLDAAVAELPSPDEEVTRSFGWQDVPEDAPSVELGNGLAYYESESPAMPFNRSRGLVIMCLGGGLLFFGVVTIPLILVTGASEKMAAYACGSLPLGVFCLLIGWAIFAMSPYKLKYTFGARLWICEHGLLWCTGNQYHEWKWQDIIGCRHIPTKSDIVTVAYVDYEFQVKDRPPLILASSKRSFIIANFMTNRIGYALWQHRLRARFQADKPINFGDVKIDWHEITIDKTTISWDRVRRVSFHIEMFVVHIDNTAQREVPIENVEHPTLCQQLCQTLVDIANPVEPEPFPSAPPIYKSVDAGSAPPSDNPFNFD